jgi:hypothetical protein
MEGMNVTDNLLIPLHIYRAPGPHVTVYPSISIFVLE